MIPILILIVCIQIVTIRGDCDYEQYISGRTLAVRRNRGGDYLISTKQRNYNIPADRSVELFCGSGFTLNYRNLGKIVRLDCGLSGNIYYSIDYDEGICSENVHFYCTSISPSFYAQEFHYCEYAGFFSVIEINDTPIVLAEFCYNYNNYTNLVQEIISVHYVAGKRNTLLKAQKDYNPSKSYEYILDDAAKISPSYEKYPPRIELENIFTVFNPNLKHLLKEIHYEFHELVPSHLYTGHFNDFIEDMKSTNTIPWWMPLKNGNWETFQRLLSKETSKRNYEIYAGQSGVVSYPEDFVCNSINELTYEYDEEQMNVRLYIWNYLLPRSDDHNDKAKEFVLVAINSPFTKTIANNSFVLCDDICNQIDWLRPLEPTRQIAGFGYIFCCNPDDVKYKLNGFPKL